MTDPKPPGGELSRPKVATLWLCRLCHSLVPGEAIHPTPHAELDGRISAPTKAARIGTHECSRGVVGVTDLVGASEGSGHFAILEWGTKE